MIAVAEVVCASKKKARALEQKNRRAAAREKGICGQCTSHPVRPGGKDCQGCYDRRITRKTAKGIKPPTPAKVGAAREEGDYQPPFHSRLAKATAEDKCEACGAKAAFRFASFCVEHGKEYVAS